MLHATPFLDIFAQKKKKMLKLEHQTCLCYCVQNKIQAFDCQKVARIQKKTLLLKIFGTGRCPGLHWGAPAPRPPQRTHQTLTLTKLRHWIEMFLKYLYITAHDTQCNRKSESFSHLNLLS